MSEILESKYASKLIRISAHDRNFSIPNQTSTNFTVNVPNNVTSLKNVVAISPVSCHMPNMFYNVYNGFFSYSYIGNITNNLTTVVNRRMVPDGQYDIDEFMTAFVETWNTYHPNDTMTYSPTTSQNPDLDPITYRLKLQFPFNITIETGPEQRIAEILGFSHISASVSTNGLLYAPYAFDLSGNDAVYIHSRTLSNGCSDLEVIEKDIHSILMMPLDQNFSYTCYWKNNSSSSNLIKFNTPRNITSIPISVRDNRGTLLDINGADWTLTIKVFYLV